MGSPPLFPTSHADRAECQYRQRPVAALSMMVVGLALAVAIGSGGIASAQTATPTPFDASPERCTVEPRTMPELERLLAAATPGPAAGRPAAGEPIDPASETAQAVQATIAELIACLNAGDRMRAYALYTDAYLATILQPEDLPAVATPQPADDDERTRIVAIELHALPGDRVLATVTLDPALIPVQKIFEFVLVEIDGHWRIDAVINEIDFSIP